jgi:hypothetical protein
MTSCELTVAKESNNISPGYSLRAAMQGRLCVPQVWAGMCGARAMS